MRKVYVLILVLYASTLINCVGRHKESTINTDGAALNHSELANEFVKHVWEGYDYEVSLVKVDTLQDGYIVVLDHDLGIYDAFWIGGYHIGEDFWDYIDEYNEYMFYNVQAIGNNVYKDIDTGYLFERAKSNTVYDVKQLVEEITNAQIKNVAANLLSNYDEFGLNQERALALAKISGTMKISDTKILTEADYQDGLYDALGVEALELVDALTIKAETGDTKKFDQLALVIAETNELTGGIEAVNDIIAAVSAGIQ